MLKDDSLEEKHEEYYAGIWVFLALIRSMGMVQKTLFRWLPWLPDERLFCRGSGEKALRMTKEFCNIFNAKYTL